MGARCDERESYVDHGRVGIDDGYLEAASGVVELVAGGADDVSGPSATVSASSDESARCGLSKMVEGGMRGRWAASSTGARCVLHKPESHRGPVYSASVITDGIS